MLAAVLSGFFSFISAAFKGARAGVAYSFSTPQLRKLSSLTIVFLVGYSAINRATVGWEWWFLTALFDTGYAMLIIAIGLWVEADHSVTITPGPEVRQSGPFSMR